ncbi:MAG: TraB/GumN family protein [bacterium]|nr:TraB/GumN family protein [bacterium]
MNRFLLIVVFPLCLCSQTANKYPSLLWKITGNGIKKPSYLYGTMHVSNRVAWYLSEQFFEALKSVEVVGLETNPGEWLENMEKTGELQELSQVRSPDLSQTDFYKYTFRPKYPEKGMLQGILSYDPDIINGLLYRQNRSKENFEENTYIDLFIYQSASKLNKKVISLENFAQSEIKARLSSLPDDEPETSTNSSNYYDHTAKIEDAYRDGNLDMLDSLSKQASSTNTQKYLIEDRNVFFVHTIDSVLKLQSLFSGVGAAHLPGPHGVIELLRERGFSVEPVMAKVSNKSTATREKLDEMSKSVAFSKQFIPDSTFSVDAPGKFYPIVELGDLNYYIHADMVNGNFYTIVRLNHAAPVFHISSSEMLLRIDSLLFESIPGKIISKKEIVSNTGIKGIDIVNTTRSGEDQRYRIFFTNTEMILFKVGGKHNYASGKEADRFFSSIRFKSPAAATTTFAPLTKGFVANIPTEHYYLHFDGISTIGLAEDLFAYDGLKKQCYGVQQAIYNDFDYLEVDSFELVRFTKNTLHNYSFDESLKYSLTTAQQFPAVQFHATNSRGDYIDGRIIIKGVHYYFVYQINEKGSTADFSFLDSFKLTDFEFLNPIKKITDKDFLFAAKDEVTDDALSRFNEAYASAYKATRKKTDPLKNDFAFKSGDKFYYSPSSKEYIKIVFEKYNDYDYRNQQELQGRIDRAFAESGTMMLTNKKLTTDSNSFYYQFSLKDTATSRAVKVQLYFKNGTMHELTAPYDTSIGLRGWTKEFMESFSPLDSVVGKNIFENKFGTLLRDLSSNDTTARQRANKSVPALVWHKDFTRNFVTFISDQRIHLVNNESRAQLFVNGGTLGSETIIQPYKNLYKHYTDSFYLQLCLLKGLAYLKTENSFSAFSDLLLSEPPLVGDEQIISDIFNVLHDSLEFCAKFYPAMLTLTKYDEYRNAVYALLGELVHNNLISPVRYAAQKEHILEQASLEAKRYNTLGVKQSGNSERSNFDHLEKNSRELAESIRGSLEGLANNNLYKGSDYLKNLVSATRQPLVNYAYVLSPFYKSDEKTKQFFVRLAKFRNQDIFMPVTIDLLKRNISINDTMITYFSKNKFTRAYFYSELEKEKLTSHFDKKYLSQGSLNESVLLSQKQLNQYYNTDKDFRNKDSLLLLREQKGKNKYQEGTLYIYKNVKSKSEEEFWTSVFVENTPNNLSSRIEILNSTFYPDPKKSESVNINILAEQFALTFRKRVGTSSHTGD